MIISIKNRLKLITFGLLGIFTVGALVLWYFGSRPLLTPLTDTPTFRFMTGQETPSTSGKVIITDPSHVTPEVMFKMDQMICAFNKTRVAQNNKARAILGHEGNVQEGNKVVIVDDVVTTGQSTIEAIDRARESNLNVIKAIALVDRQEGGRENIEKRNVPFESIFTRDDLMNLYKK